MPRLFLCAALVFLAALPLNAGFVGRNSPIVIDTNGNGMPDGGDQTIIPTFSALTNQMTIPNPWESAGGEVLNVLAVSNPDGSNRFRTMSRTNKNEMQVGTVDQVTADGRALHVTINTSPAITPPTKVGINGTATGGGGFVDTNSDGLYDTIHAVGPFGTADIPLTHADTDADGYADFLSIPWAQSSILGVNTSDATPDPQVFVPMGNVVSPTGPPDSVALDLDANGTPDPQFLMSPVFGPAAVGGGTPVPAVSQIGLAALAVALAAIALTRLRGTLGLGA